MAESDKTILIEVDINASDALAGTAKLKTEVNELTEELKGYKKGLEQGVKSMNDVVKKESELINKKAELRANQRLLTASLNSEKNSYNQLSAQYSTNINKLNTLSAEYKSTSEDGKKLVADTEAIRLEMIKAKEATQDYTLNVGNYENAAKSLRPEIKKLTAEIADMKLNQREGTEEYKKAINRLGELKDTMADVAAESKILGSDTKNIDMLVGSMQAVGAVGQLAESAMQIGRAHV